MKVISNEEALRALDSAPLPVQEVVRDIATVSLILEVGEKHKLHVDMIGTLAELNRNMLLGLVSPAEFVSELSTSGVDGETAKSIATEINEKIFIPVRKKMQEQGVVPKKITSSQTLLPTPPKGKLAVPVAITNVRTMQSDIAEMKGAPHAAPRIIMPLVATTPAQQNMIVHPPLPTPEMASKPAPMTSQPTTISSTFEPAPLSPRPTPPPPPNLPGVAASTAFQSSSIPTQKEPVAPVPFPKPLQTPSAIQAPKTYNADPYREPME